MDNLRELRMALVNAQDALTTARDNWNAYLGSILKDVKIKATTKEAREIEIAGLFGNDPKYKAELYELRHAEYNHSRAEAILESAKDARRKWEWDIRSRLADALFRQGVQSDHQDYADDGTWDNAVDNEIAGISGELASRHTWTNIETGEVHSRDGIYRPSDDFPF